MKLKALIILFFAGILSSHIYSQTADIIDNDSLLRYYLEHNPDKADTNSEAILLSKIEKIGIDEQRDWSSSTCTVYQERCYKILSQDALNLAAIAIPTSYGLKAKNINIYVCYFENGEFVKKKITKSDAIKETLVRGVKVLKFNISELKVGRILYFSFQYLTELSLHHYYTMPIDFCFEDKFPVVNASYEIRMPSNMPHKYIPKNITFDTVKTPDAITTDKNTIYQKKTPKYETTIWTANNLPKTTEESYVKDADYKLKSVKALIDCNVWDTTKITKEILKTFLYKPWNEALRQSKFRALFPQDLFLDKDDSLDKIPVLNAIDSFRTKGFRNSDDTLSFVKSVYNFVRDSIKTVYNGEGFSYMRRYQTVIKKREGNILEKNALLTYFYQRMGLSARNIILSTDEKLDINDFDPTVIDYMVSVVTLGKQYYLLDAGNGFLPFGAIPVKCYNGTAIVMNNECLPFEISSLTYNDKLSVSYTVAPGASDNVFALKIEERYGKASGASERAFIHKDTVENRDYFREKVNQLKYNITLQDWKIENEKYLDSQLIIRYNLDLTLENGSPYAYFNPFMRKISINPFKDVERIYPIEFGLGPDIYYQFKIVMPANIQIEEYPESTSIQCKDGALTYNQTVTFDAAKNALFLTYAFKAKQFEFPAEDYAAVRSFYEQLVTEQAKQIVFKKLN